MSLDPENPYRAPLAFAETVVAEAAAELHRPKPRVWTVFVVAISAFVVSIGFQIVVAIGAVVYLFSQGSAPQEMQERLGKLLVSPWLFNLAVILGPGTFGVFSLVAARFSPEPWRHRLGLVPVQCSQSIYPLSMIGSLFLLAIGLALAEALVRLAPWLPVDPTAKMLYEDMTVLRAIPFIIVIGLVPGFCEELLFRGYVQRRLTARWGPAAGILLASVAFGVAHLMPHVVLFATVLGIWFGVVAWKSGSIWPTICCHAFVNSGLNTWRVVAQFGEIPENVQWGVDIGAIVVGAICFLLSLWVLFGPRPSGESATGPVVS